MSDINQNNFLKFMNVYIKLIVISLIFYIPIIVNPGFYSHDELQIYDQVSKLGLLKFIGNIISTDVTNYEFFSIPYRPIPMIWEGILSVFMKDYTFVVHLINVLIHSFGAFIFYLIIQRISNGNNKLAMISSIIFLLNPLSIFAFGWSAALMDQFYVIFLMAAFLVTLANTKNLKISFQKSLQILLLISAAMLSKETAIICPLFFIIFWNKLLLNDRRVVINFLLWLIPAIIFFGLRFNSILNSFHSLSSNSYHPDISNSIYNLFVYFVYPFVINSPESAVISTIPKIYIYIAFLLHSILLIFLYKIFNLRTILTYILCYFLFLLPVVTLPFTASHYTYASSIFLSLALVAIYFYANNNLYKNTYLFCASFVLIFHSIYIQNFFYTTGLCMTRLTNSLTSYYLSTHNEKVNIQVELGSPEHIIKRTLHFRDNLYIPKEINFVKSNGKDSQDRKTLIFDNECYIYSQSRY
jgi:hypothetical protein